MPQPSSPPRTSAPHGVIRRFVALALMLAVLIGADIWLLVQFAKAAGMALAEFNGLLIAMLAASGRAIMAAGALLLTWMLVEDLADSLRGNIRSDEHKFYTR